MGSGYGLVAIGQDGGAGEDLELFDLGELGDDVFGHAIAEIFVVFAIAEIFEIEDGYGFFRGGSGGLGGGGGAGLSLGVGEAAGRIAVALEAFEIGFDFGGGLVAEVAVFFDRFVDDALEFGGDRRIEGCWRPGSSVKNGIENRGGGVPGESELAGGHFIEDRAE